MRFGLRFRLGLLLAAFGVLATGLTGLYSFTQSRELLVRAAERDLMSSTQIFGSRFATVIRGISDDVRLLGELEVTRGIPLMDEAGIQSHQSALADTFQALLKARPAVGDAELGEQYIAALMPNLKGIQVARLGWVEKP